MKGPSELLTQERVVERLGAPLPPARQLRVCMVVHAYYEGDARVRRYAESLAAIGHDVEVLALRAPGKPPRETLAGVAVRRVPLSRRRGGLLRYLFEYVAFTLLCGLELLRRARRCDVVHVHNMPDFLVFAALGPRLCGARVVLDVHDLMPEVWASKFKTSLRHPAMWPLRLQEWLSHRFASAVVFATERFRACAIARGTVRSDRSIAVMNAADTRVFDRTRHPWRGPEQACAFEILYLGTVSHRHGVDQCVRVLPLLRDRIPGARLVIHAKLSEGEGQPLRELQELAQQLGVADRVQVRPPLPLEQVPAAMSRASVGVFTPHLDVHIDMALSLKVPEFVAMGVPVVAVETSIMRELFRRDEVLLFADGDLPAFADCLLRVHTDNRAAVQMTRRADRFTSEHAWEREFTRYLELLQRLVRHGRVAAARPGPNAAAKLAARLATPLALGLGPPVMAVIAWPLLAFVLLLDLCCWPVAALWRRRWRPVPRDLGAVSVVTVSWNGRHFLQVLLPSLQRELRAHGGDHEVIVVDNGSTDGTVAWLALEHPWVRVVALPENRHFVGGNRAGVAAARHDVLVFLNNDMEVKPGFLLPLLAGLRDPRVFAVAAEVFFRNAKKRREETGRTRGGIERGWLSLAHVMPTRDERELEFTPTLWAGGGSAAFCRRTYAAIGGFDALYDPFYMEDMGLSWQAWKRGYRCLFTSRSAVIHEHRGTSRKAFGDDYVDGMIRRNQHLFAWANLTDPRSIGTVLGLLPLSALLRARRPGRTWLGGYGFEWSALLRALPRLPLALWRRCAARRHYELGDRAALSAANGLTAHRAACGTQLGTLPVPASGGRRVLVLSARLPRQGHDGSWILFDRLRAMAARHRVTLFAFLDDRSDAAAVPPLRALGIEVVTAMRERNPIPGNLHHAVPARLFRDYSAPSMRAAVRRVVEGTDFDIVQIEYLEMAHLTAGLRLSGPAIYVCHESMTLAVEREAATRGGLWAAIAGSLRLAQAARFERCVLRRCDRLVALAAADAATIEWLLPGRRVTVIPSAVPLPVLPLRPLLAGPPTLVFVGFYRHAPNVDAAQWLVHEILPRILANVPDVRVRLIGRGAPAAVAALGRAGVVELPGYVEDLSVALAAATVVVLPLRHGGGLRGKLLEAFAAGCAVVTTRVAAAGVAAVDDRHCLLADDAAGFAAAVVRLLGDAALRVRLGGAARELVATQHSIAAVAGAFDSVYADMPGAACRP